MALLMACAAPVVHILWACFLCCVMAAMALAGALVNSNYKWGKYRRVPVFLPIANVICD